MSLNKIMLPGNIPGSESPIIPVQSRNGTPVSVIMKNPPKLLEKVPTQPPTEAEDRKETNANKFPILRGFA